MSHDTPSTEAEISNAVAWGRPFASTAAKGIQGHTVAVLTGHLNNYDAPITGPLSDEVKRTLRDYSEQYLTGGGRERPLWHVVYWVARVLPDGSRYVLGYVTARGDLFTDDTVTGKRPQIVRDALRVLVDSGNAAWHTADGAQPYGRQDGQGATFRLVTRSETLGEYTDRAEAYDARNAAGKTEIGRHAWIERIYPPVTYRFSATVNGKRRTCTFTQPSNWDAPDVGEAELTVMNDSAAYHAFYGADPEESDLAADLEDVAVERVTP